MAGQSKCRVRISDALRNYQWPLGFTKLLVASRIYFRDTEDRLSFSWDYSFAKVSKLSTTLCCFTVLEGNQCPSANDPKVFATLKKICAVTVAKSCQYLLRNFSEGCQYPMTQISPHLQEGRLIKMLKNKFCALSLKNIT